MNAFEIRAGFEEVINNAFPDIGFLVFGSRKEVRTVEAQDRSVNISQKKIGKFPVIAFTDQNSHNFVSIFCQYLVQSNGLRQMSPPFTLHNKQKFHQSSQFNGQI
jgi:hypothetical protein